MKKLLLILFITILCSSLVNAEKYMFVVDDKGPSTDVITSTNLVTHLISEDELSGYSHLTALNSEVSKSDLSGKLTIFIYKGEAVIIDDADNELAQTIHDTLENKFSIPTELIELSFSNKYDDLKEYLGVIEVEETTEEPEVEKITIDVNKEKQQENIQEFKPKKSVIGSFFQKIIDWFKSLFS